jgi:hypothetical protein
MTLVAVTVAGSFAVDFDEETVEPCDEVPSLPPPPSLNLPRVVDAAAAGSTVVALVAAKPPLLVSHDAGSTWRDSGRGLPPGRAVAIDADDPDLVAYAARNRLYVSRDGGVFWHALAVELPEVERLVFS